MRADTDNHPPALGSPTGRDTAGSGQRSATAADGLPLGRVGL